MTQSVNRNRQWVVSGNVRRSSRLARSVIGALLAAGAFSAHASAQEARSSDAADASDSRAAVTTDRPGLDTVLHDLQLNQFALGARLSDNTVKLPLSSNDWTLSGLRPYAALSPRVLRAPGEGLLGLAAPDREAVEDLNHGLGLGAGFSWRLSDHLDVFGQYLFRVQPTGGIPNSNPLLRPDADGSGLKGGFSIRF